MDPPIPKLADLGLDLLHVPRARVAACLMAPFLCVGLYVFLTVRGLWPFVVLPLVYLSFVTYGSVSHDLVHRNLGLPPRVNDLLLSLIELLG
jgi:beta-carotene hydroxylase